MKSEVIQVRVDEKLFKEIKKLADLDHRTVSDYVRVELIKIVENSKNKK
jgi:hypothetical protein